MATGTVKWFNGEKGYGFIAVDNGADAFVHYSAIQMEGYRTLEVGQRVEFQISHGRTGPQVEDLIAREPQSSLLDASTLGLEIIGDRLRMLHVQPDGDVSPVYTTEQAHTFLHIAMLQSAGWRTLVEELEEMINSPQARESDLQQFFERNPDFLCGDSYEEARPHIVLQREGDGPLIPDFALRPHNPQALCDLLEIKLPKARILRKSKNRVRLSSALLEATGQLREYRDYFNDREYRRSVEDIYGLRFFQPRMMVLIGKRSHYSPTDFRKAESDIPQLNVVTYDDILERARARMRGRNF